MPRTKAIATPEELEALFNEYAKWVEENPYKVQDFVGKDALEVYREKERPLTWVGFESWLLNEGIVSHLGHYEQNTGDSYTEYLPIIRACKKRCSSSVINGALVGVFNQNIAARLEGLKDTKEVQHQLPTPFLNNDPLSDGSDTANESTS